MGDDLSRTPGGLLIQKHPSWRPNNPRYVAFVDTCEGTFDRVLADCLDRDDRLRAEGHDEGTAAAFNRIGRHIERPTDAALWTSEMMMAAKAHQNAVDAARAEGRKAAFEEMRRFARDPLDEQPHDGWSSEKRAACVAMARFGNDREAEGRKAAEQRADDWRRQGGGSGVE